MRGSPNEDMIEGMTGQLIGDTTEGMIDQLTGTTMNLEDQLEREEWREELKEEPKEEERGQLNNPRDEADMPKNKPFYDIERGIDNNSNISIITDLILLH